MPCRTVDPVCLRAGQSRRRSRWRRRDDLPTAATDRRRAPFTSGEFRNRIVNCSVGRVRGMGYFGYGELPLVLLALLGQRPVNGYELLGRLGKLFSPGYVPSPGSVYPARSALSRSGLIEAKDDNGKKQYRLTPAGEEALDARRGQLGAIEARCGVYLRDRS